MKSAQQLTHADYRSYYASNCDVCKGEGTVLELGVRKECVCQKKARRKFRFEQIDIYPPDLKYKSWSDFTGVITQHGQVVGHLQVDSIIAARDKAFQYCYGASFDKSLLKERHKHLKIHKHLLDGQNLVIVGDERAGRSLLGAIICKEVANATVVLNRDIDYRWIKFYDILNAARWIWDSTSGTNKAVDHGYLDMLGDLDFLFIDGIDLQRGKNYPADHIALDTLFGARSMYCKPTILICSRQFFKMLSNSAGYDHIVNAYGIEFGHLFRKLDTIYIDLVRENDCR